MLTIRSKLNAMPYLKLVAHIYIICVVAFSNIAASAGILQTIGLTTTKIIFAVLTIMVINNLTKVQQIYFPRKLLLLSIFVLYVTTYAFLSPYDYEIMTLVFVYFTALFYSYIFDSINDIYDMLKSIVVGCVILIIMLLFVCGSVSNLLIVISNEELSELLIQKNIIAFLMAQGGIICVFLGIYKKAPVYYILLIPILFLLLGTGSRRGLFSFIFGGGLLYLLNGNGIRLIKNIIMTMFMMYILYIAINQLDIFQSINKRLSSLIEGFIGTSTMTTSDQSRFKMINYGWNMFKINPIIGYGPGAFKEIAGFGKYSHNNYVELLFNLGFIGFILFYGHFCKIFYTLIQQFKEKDPLCLFFIIYLAVRLISDIGNVSYYDKLLFIIFGTVVAYIDIVKNQDYNIYEEQKMANRG